MLTQTELPQLVANHGPNCIVFTPDKNRTWAQSMGLPKLDGHRHGGDTARTIIRECFALGVRDVVFWAMSQSNFGRRPKQERDQLVELLKEEMERQEKQGEEYGFYLCGDLKAFGDPELLDLAERAQERTRPYQRQRLTVLMNYRGITDWKRANSRLSEVMGAEALENEDLIRQYMWVKHLPPQVDLFIRTGVTEDTRRNSDSLLPLHGEQAVVKDFPVYWPSFTKEHLHQAIRAFAQCERPKGY